MKRRLQDIESFIQRDVRVALGAKPGLVMMRNNVGHAQHVTSSGNVCRITYGLGEGSADLVGCLAGCACPHCGQTVPWGRFIAIEVKSPRGKQSEEQAQWQRMLEANGGFYAVVRSVQEAEAAYAHAMRGAL